MIPLQKIAITLFLLISVPPNINGLSILGIVPRQMHSHNIMCQELMRGLAVKGHQVDVYSHFPLDKPIPNYKDYSLRGLLPELTNSLTYDVVEHILTPAGFINNVLEPVTKSLCELLKHPHFEKLLRDPPKKPPYDLVILEFSQSHCYIPWGRHSKIPIIGIITLPIFDMIHEPLGNPLSLATEPSIFSEYASPMSFYQRLNNVIVHYTGTFLFNRMIRRQDDYVKDYFSPDYPNNLELVKDFSLILINHHWSMSGKKVFTPGCRRFKFLHNNTKAFVTHGGLMGSQEVIHYGVPLIATPLFADQRFNVAYFVERKIAGSFDLNTITVESFTDTMKQVLENPVHKKAAKRVSEEFRDRPMPPVDTAIYWVEYISRHGKDALRSSLVDMPWWQASLIDVYGSF